MLPTSVCIGGHVGSFDISSINRVGEVEGYIADTAVDGRMERWMVQWTKELYHIRGKKITCPGARDKLNFRQDKHIFSPNVRRTSEKFSASLFDNIFGQVN